MSADTYTIPLHVVTDAECHDTLPTGNLVAWTLAAVQSPHMFKLNMDRLPTLERASGNQEHLLLTITPEHEPSDEEAIAAAAQLVQTRLGPMHGLVTLAALVAWVKQGPASDGYLEVSCDQLLDLLSRQHHDTVDRDGVLRIVRDLEAITASIVVHHQRGKRKRDERVTGRLFDIAKVIRQEDGEPERHIFKIRVGYWASLALHPDWRYVVAVPRTLLALHPFNDAMAIHIGSYLALRARSRHGAYTYRTESLLAASGVVIDAERKSRFRQQFEKALDTLRGRGIVSAARCLDPVPAASEDPRRWWRQWLDARWELLPSRHTAALLKDTERRYLDYRKRGQHRRGRKPQ